MNKSIGQSRLLQEMKSMVKDKAPNLFSQPLENDLFIWHFTILGPENTDFHEGIYHGQIVLPFEYPFKPPDIYFFTKNGRFEVSTKICLTITQYHPEEWNAGWTIRTMLEAVISLFNEHVPGVGYLEATSEVRKGLAHESKNYVCDKCGPIVSILTPRKPLVVPPVHPLIVPTVHPLVVPLFEHKMEHMAVMIKPPYTSLVSESKRQGVEEEHSFEEQLELSQSETGEDKAQKPKPPRGKRRGLAEEIQSNINILYRVKNSVVRLN